MSMAQAIAIVGIWVGVGATAFAPSIGENIPMIGICGVMATATICFLME